LRHLGLVEVLVKVTRYVSATEFLRRARAPLEQEEAANSLIVGIAARVAERPAFYGDYPVYLATVDEGDELVAAAVRTPPHNVIVYSARGGDCEPLGLLLDDILDFTEQNASDSPSGRLPGVTAHAPTAETFSTLWSERSGRPYEIGFRQRIYELRTVTGPDGVPGHLRQAKTEDLDLLANWVYNFNIDAHLPPVDMLEAWGLAERRVDAGDLFLWEDEGRPVSMAMKVRPTSRGISVSLVYTPRELRGRGYASACVAALSQQLLDAGWQFCSLYTDLANPTSNSIYQRIGYRPVCDSTEYHFVND
jgi:GNAT superfamily N-acetyltransferase